MSDSFKKDFFERMETLNYDRYIEDEKYIRPTFLEKDDQQLL